MKMRSSRPYRRVSSTLSLAMIASMMLSLIAGVATLPASAAAQTTDTGLVDDTTYVSPQFGYIVAWGDPWSTRARNITSNEGGFDSLTLRNGSSSLRITGRAGGEDLGVVLDDAIALETTNAPDAIIDSQDDGDVPTATLTINANTVMIEVQDVPDAEAIIVIVLTARTTDFDSVLVDAQDVVTINDASILTGEAIAGGTSSTSKGKSDKTIATDEATTTPEEAATATEAASQDRVSENAPAESGIDGTTYTSPNFDYTFEWNDRDWTVSPDGEVSQTDPPLDSLYLEADTGNLYIYAWEGYEGDPAACLQGEADYYENDSEGVADWSVAKNADGDPLTDETRTSAWGVFNLTYTNPDEKNAEPVKLTDYIECRTLVPGESILIIFASAPRASYNDHIDLVQEVIDTIEIPEATPSRDKTPKTDVTATPDVTETTEATETPDVTETEAVTPEPTAKPAKTKTSTTTQVEGLEGSVFTSPSFGFVFTIPSDFSIQDATVEKGDETFTLTNGVSLITVHATDDSAYTDSLTSCVEAVATDAGADKDRFRLDRTADGAAFQGSDDRSAYANYTYTGSDGVKYAYFIECRAIEANTSMLIVTQEVPYDQYTTERAARREIQNSIQMP